jgi:hypothetical protein
MMDGSYVTFSEIIGHMPTQADIESCFSLWMGGRILLLCRMNVRLCRASASEGTACERAVGAERETWARRIS